jgi:peptidyl-prolyl cis-trans isomerase C
LSAILPGLHQIAKHPMHAAVSPAWRNLDERQKMKASFTGLLTAVAALALIAAAPVAHAQSKVLAKVDGVEITEDDARIAAEGLGPDLPPVGNPQREKVIVDFLIDLKVLSAAAEKDKVQDQPEFAKRLEIARQRTLMERYMVSESAKKTDDASLQASYDEYAKAQPQAPEVRARHILVKTEEEAKKVQERLKAGEDFAKLAGELSTDPGSGKQGGDLGYFTKDRMVPEFGEAAFALEPGQVSGIVKSQFGFHIIKLEDKRISKPPTFEQVKEQWKQYVMRRTQQELVLRLRKEAKIERFDAASTEPPAEAPAAPAEAPK